MSIIINVTKVTHKTQMFRDGDFIKPMEHIFQLLVYKQIGTYIYVPFFFLYAVPLTEVSMEVRVKQNRGENNVLTKRCKTQ